MDRRNAKITLSWEITDFDLADYTDGKCIVSPIFHLDILDNTEWVLKLGLSQTGYLVFQLVRCETDKGPDEVKIGRSLFLVGHGDQKFICAAEESLCQRCDTLYGFLSAKHLPSMKSVYWPRNVLTVECYMNGHLLQDIPPVFYIGITNVASSTFEFKWEASSSIFDLDTYIQSPRVYLSDKTYCVVKLMKKLKDTFYYYDCEIWGSARNSVCVIHAMYANQCPFSSPTFVLAKGNKIHNVCCSVPVSSIKLLQFQCKFRISNGSYDSPEARKVPVTEFTVISPGRSLGTDLIKMYSEQSLCDFSLQTDGGEVFNVHSVILASRSPVFHRLLNSDFKETNTKVMNIVDTDAGTIKLFLNFVYSDKVDDLNIDKARKLYIVADKYDVSELRAICNAFLVNNLSVDSVCDMLELAERHSDLVMKKSAQSFLSCNTKLVLSSDKWKTFQENNLLLSLEILNVLALKSAF